MVLSLFLGRYEISFMEALGIFSKLFSGDLSDKDFSTYNVLFNVRLPRIILVVLVGSSLALSGAIFQAIFRNPLVSPDILGVSSGASFGAVLGLLLKSGSMLWVQALSFVFGVLAVSVAYLISKAGRFNRVLMLILSGIIVSSFFHALVSIIKYIADPYNELPAMVFWSMGGFFRVSWTDFFITGPVIIVGIMTIIMLRWKLNMISLGDDEAITLGIDIKLLRKIFIFLATLIVASGISICGTIGWVGLIVPHIARIIIGPNHGKMILLTGILGAIFLLVTDDLARSLTTAEIPIGILTSLIGAPFFCYIMLTKRKSGWA